MDDVTLAMLGDPDVAERLTAREEMLPCPLCNENLVWIGVHDDEGNYHGPLGCNYEDDPYSGLSYALHHDGWGQCALCSGGFSQIMGGVLFDSAEDTRRYWNRRILLLTAAQMEALERMEGVK